MKQVKGILFDFNGTLFFDSELHMRCFEEAFDKFGLPNRGRSFILQNIFGRTNAQIFGEVYLPNPTEEQIEGFELWKEGKYMEMIRREPDSFKLDSNVCEMLDYLKENSIPYCIATGSPLMNVEFYINELGIDRWFTMENIVYSDGTFPGKPCPDIYMIAADRLGLKPCECAVFEDGTSGIRAANSAGAASVIAVWEEGFPSPIVGDAKVDAQYHSFAQWREMLSALGLA